MYFEGENHWTFSLFRLQFKSKDMRCGFLETWSHLRMVLFQDHGQVPITSGLLKPSFSRGGWFSLQWAVCASPAAKAITWFLYECPHRPPGLRCFCVLSFLFCLYTKLVETHLFQRLVVIPISLFRMIAYFSELMGEHTCNNFHSRSLDTRSYYRWEVNPGLMRFRSS